MISRTDNFSEAPKCADVLLLLGEEFLLSIVHRLATMQSRHFTLVKTEGYFSEIKMALSFRYIGQLVNNIDI